MEATHSDLPIQSPRYAMATSRTVHFSSFMPLWPAFTCRIAWIWCSSVRDGPSDTCARMPLLCTVLSFHELNLMAHIRSAARTFSSVQTRKLFDCMQAVLACCFSACMSELPSKSYATGKTRIIIIVSTAGNTLSAVRCEKPDKLPEPACVHTCTCTPLRVQCKLVNGVKDV